MAKCLRTYYGITSGFVPLALFWSEVTAYFYGAIFSGKTLPWRHCLLVIQCFIVSPQNGSLPLSILLTPLALQEAPCGSLSTVFFWRHICGAMLRRNFWLHTLGTLLAQGYDVTLWRHSIGWNRYPGGTKKCLLYNCTAVHSDALHS